MQPDAAIFAHLEEKFAEGHCQRFPVSHVKLQSGIPVLNCPTIVHLVCLVAIYAQSPIIVYMDPKIDPDPKNDPGTRVPYI